MFILAIFSIFFGYITKDLFIGLGSNFLFADNSIFIHPIHEIMINTEFAVPTIFKLLPFICTITFSVIAVIILEFLFEFTINFKLSRLGYNIFGFFNQRFLVEFFYNKYIVDLILKLGEQTTKILDKGGIELLGPTGLEYISMKLNKNISNSSTSFVTHYALFIFLFFNLYIFIYTLFTLDSLILSLIILMLFSIFTNINKNYNNNNMENTLQSNLLLISRSFSTSSVKKMPESGNNNNNNDRLSKEQKEEIKNTVNDYYENNTPIFIDPKKNELEQFNTTNSENEVNKYGQFIDKHSNTATHKANECKANCENSVTDEITRKYPNVNPQEIRSEVIRESEAKYYDEHLERNVLPGQSKWYRELQEEGMDSADRIEDERENRSEPASDSGSDSGLSMNSGGTDASRTYTNEDFINQRVYTENYTIRSQRENNVSHNGELTASGAMHQEPEGYGPPSVNPSNIGPSNENSQPSNENPQEPSNEDNWNEEPSGEGPSNEDNWNEEPSGEGPSGEKPTNEESSGGEFSNFSGEEPLSSSDEEPSVEQPPRKSNKRKRSDDDDEESSIQQSPGENNKRKRSDDDDYDRDDEDAKRIKLESNNDDDNNSNNKSGGGGIAGISGPSEGGSSSNGGESSGSLYRIIYTFWFGKEKNKDYESPLDYVIEIEELDMISIIDFDC